MGSYKGVLEDINKRNKNLLEGKLGKYIKQADQEKGKYQKTMENIKELSTKIQSYIQKFDDLKNNMTANSTKFESYNQDVETKK